MDQALNVAIAGFGFSGRVFHAPFIHVNPGFNLHTIVTSREEAHDIYPDAIITKDFNTILSDENIDLIIICSPNQLHYNQVSKALKAGKHVIVEKPLTPTSQETADLIQIAKANNKLLFPFHNRRWDGDFMTIKQIIDQDLLGNILDFEVHFDRYVPGIEATSWRYTNKVGGGTLFDLGIHMIDQVVCLFGMPEAVFCCLYNQRKHSVVDDSFNLNMIYPNRNVRVSASVFVREPGPRFIVHGERGSFIKSGIDPQEENLINGMPPVGNQWGRQNEKDWGIIHTEVDKEIIRNKFETLAGNYMGFFDNVFNAISNSVDPEVKPEQALNNIRIIEKAFESNNNRKIVSCTEDI